MSIYLVITIKIEAMYKKHIYSLLLRQLRSHPRYSNLNKAFSYSYNTRTNLSLPHKFSFSTYNSPNTSGKYGNYGAKSTFYESKTKQDEQTITSSTALDFSSFFAGDNKNIYSIQEGGYVDIKMAEVQKILPEGLAGDTLEEFQFSGRTSWMIRDTGKLLCRLVDDYQKESQNPVSGDSVKSFSLSPSVPGLTDRPEWTNSIIRVRSYGIDMFDRLVDRRSNGLSIQDGDGSIIQECSTNIKKHGSPKKILLTGTRGVGKSIALNQMVIHARQQGWLCLFIPKAWEHVCGGTFIEPCVLQEISTSESSPELFDNPFVTAPLLRNFMTAHETILSTLPIQNKDVLGKYSEYIDHFKEVAQRFQSLSGTTTTGKKKQTFMDIRAAVEEEDNFEEEDEFDAPFLKEFNHEKIKLETLSDLIRLGIAFRDLAGTIFMDLVEEIRLVDSVPVLIAIDQYNVWEGNSSYQYDNKVIKSRSLCVPKALHVISKVKAESTAWTLKNGLIVCAISRKHPEGGAFDFRDVVRSIPLLINVPAYSQIEYYAAVKYYMSQGLIEKNTSMQELLAYRTHVGSIGALLRKYVIKFFLPLQFDRFEDDFADYSDIDPRAGMTGKEDLDLDEDSNDRRYS